MIAVVALESGLLHFGNDIAISNDNAAESDHFVDVLWAEFSDSVMLFQVVWTDLDEDIILLILLP